MNFEEEMAVRKELTCLFCNGTMYTPLRQCNNGHILCNDCVPSTKVCNYCGASVGSTRMFCLERILTVLKFHCKYSMYGCLEELDEKELKAHQAICRFRRIERSIFVHGRRYNYRI